jgi:SAM-dependent methyltransferase
MGENELSIAASYYKLFRSGAVKQAHGDETSQEMRPETQSSNGFWAEDEWGEEDEAHAQKTLETNREKCTVPTWESNAREDADSEAWNQFYRDHGTRFFKDRHYLEKAYPDEFSPSPTQKINKTFVEIGCGVGNALLPLFEDDSNQWQVLHGLDLSHVAIELLRKDTRFVEYNNQQEDPSAAAFAHVCDISAELPPSCVGVSDVTTLIFCLSAVDPDAMEQAARNVASSLRPGGVLVFRDYGRYDQAQMKLGVSRNKQLKDNFYRKHDGTKCYYFTLEELERLFTQAGLEVLDLKYLRRVVRNNATGETRRRVWVSGRFVKPA